MSRNLTKILPSLSEAREFASKLGILTLETYTMLKGGACRLTWRVLRLERSKGKQEGISHGRAYEVFRETEHAYLIRDDNGKVTKVNRYTMMGGRVMFAAR